jgi:hypothetical protein
MYEDKLKAAERLRLEALAQAIAASGAPIGRMQTSSDIVRRAKIFEDYIVTGNVPR